MPDVNITEETFPTDSRRMNLGKAALTLRLHSVVGGGEGCSLHVLAKSSAHERESFEDAQEAIGPEGRQNPEGSNIPRQKNRRRRGTVP